MKKISLFIVALFAITFSQAQQDVAPPAGTHVAKTEHHSGDIPWTTMQDALARSKKERKKILVDFFTDWCGWCKTMDKKTYTDPKVIELVKKYFIPVKFNAEREEAIKYRGKDYSMKAAGIRATHDLATELLEGQMGYPTTTFIKSNHEKIQNLPGYIDAKEMPHVLKYFGEDKYLTMSFEDYKKEEALAK